MGWLLRRPTVDVAWEHAFELKYLPQTSSDEAVAQAAGAAEEQLGRYLAADQLAGRPGLRGWVVVFHGPRCAVLRRTGTTIGGSLPPNRPIIDPLQEQMFRV